MKTAIQTIQKLAVLFALVSSLIPSSQAHAQVDFDYDEEGFFDSPLLLMDDSHDLIRLTKDGDEVEIEIFMFDAAEFDSIPNTLDFDLLEDLATEHDRFDVDIDDILESYASGMAIVMLGGDDVLYTDQNLDFPILVLGGDGDDFIQGTSRGDGLYGERGSDVIFGYGGDDVVDGGNNEFDIVEKDRDFLFGGSGSDTFHQTTFEFGTPKIEISWTDFSSRVPTVVGRARSSVAFDRIMDFQSWEDVIENEVIQISN